MPVFASEFPGPFAADEGLDPFAVSVQAQVALSSGLDPKKVIWERQTVHRPARPFITLDILDDAVDELLSEESVRDNPDAASDLDNVAQIFSDSTDRPEITVRITCFSDAAKAGAVLPAMRILKQVRASLGGETASDNLDPITILDRSNVRNVSVMLETAYEGRAVLDVKFGSMETNSDPQGIIETVLVETTVKNLDGSTIIDKTITLPNS